MTDIKKEAMSVYYDKSKYDIANIIAPFKGEIKNV